MKKKLMVIFICCMIMTTYFVAAKPSEKITTNKSSHKTISITNDTSAPVWEIGDQWTYKIDNITLNYIQENQSVDVFITIADLPLEVINTTNTSYTLSYTTSVNGQCTIAVDFGDGPVHITITFTNLLISGNITIEKSSLGIKELTASINGRFIIEDIEQPYFVFPFNLPNIPVPVIMNMNITYDTPLSLLKFPLNTSSVWDLQANNMTVNGNIYSIWCDCSPR